MNGFLLDTNVISEVIRRRPEPRVVEWLASTNEDLMYLSVLTLGEIRRGIAALKTGARRAALEAWLDGELRIRFAAKILPIDEAVADQWGVLAAAAAARGRPFPVVDGLLAATALHHNVTLVTRDDAHLAGAGVPVFNPWVD